jgi:hypothetical protein
LQASEGVSGKNNKASGLNRGVVQMMGGRQIVGDRTILCEERTTKSAGLCINIRHEGKYPLRPAKTVRVYITRRDQTELLGGDTIKLKSASLRARVEWQDFAQGLFLAAHARPTIHHVTSCGVHPLFSIAR